MQIALGDYTLRILVCGGRDFNDWLFLRDELDRLHKAIRIDCLIQGAARGADQMAKQWAHMRKIHKVVSVPADWQKYGKRAGYIRNARMLAEYKPDLVVAFPGGNGTAMMVMLAEQAGVEVMRFGW